MSVKLKKEHVKLSEVICARQTKTTVESDVIVPDIKPDAAKILRAGGEAVITQKNIQTDKVYIGGILRLDILYIPEDTSCGRVKSITIEQDFGHTIAANGAKPGMNIAAEVVCENPEHTLLNSRKIGLRTTLNIGIKVTAEVEMDVSTGVEDGSDVQIKSKHLKFYNSCPGAERNIIIRERLEVPAGKPDLGEVLRFSAKPSVGELKLLQGKAVLKGELKLCTLYCGDGDEGGLECMEHAVPFGEVLEIDGICENMAGEADFLVKDIYYEISRDSDGDKRVLSFEVTLCAEIRASEIVECDAVCDAYDLNSEIKTQKNLCNMEQLIDTMTAQTTVKEVVKVPEYLPEVYQVCDCSAVPEIERIAIENGCVNVSGYITCSILYMSGNEEMPVSGFSHVLPFSHSFEVLGINENSVCDVTADVEHLSFTVPGSREIEIRSIIILGLKAVNPNSCEIISEIEYDNEKPLKRPADMVIYFVQKGDSLWDVAKRYRTTSDAIVAVNGSEKECMVPGNRIYIFR